MFIFTTQNIMCFTAVCSAHGLDFHQAIKLHYRTVPVFKACIYRDMKESMFLCEDLPMTAGIIHAFPLLPGGIWNQCSWIYVKASRHLLRFLISLIQKDVCYRCASINPYTYHRSCLESKVWKQCTTKLWWKDEGLETQQRWFGWFHWLRENFCTDSQILLNTSQLPSLVNLSVHRCNLFAIYHLQIMGRKSNFHTQKINFFATSSPKIKELAASRMMIVFPVLHTTPEKQWGMLCQ